MCQFLNVPNLPVLAYFGGNIIDSSPIDGTVYTAVLAQLTTITALLSLHLAQEYVTWPMRSNDRAFLAHAFYLLYRVFCMSKRVVKIIRDELGLESKVRDTKYSAGEFNAIPDAAMTHPWRTGKAWAVWKHRELCIATPEE